MGSQRQVDLREFEDSLVYVELSQNKTQQKHTFVVCHGGNMSVTEQVWVQLGQHGQILEGGVGAGAAPGQGITVQIRLLSPFLPY